MPSSKADQAPCMRRLFISFAVTSLLAFSGSAGAHDIVDHDVPACVGGPKSVCEISLAAALAQPRQLNGKIVMTVGYLARNRHGLRLYLSEDSSLVGDTASSILVTGTEQLGDDVLTKMSESYVRLVGGYVFDGSHDRGNARITAERAYVLMRPEGRATVREIQKNEQD